MRRREAARAVTKCKVEGKQEVAESRVLEQSCKREETFSTNSALVGFTTMRARHHDMQFTLVPKQAAGPGTRVGLCV